jgi:hypothetical protein
MPASSTALNIWYRLVGAAGRAAGRAGPSPVAENHFCPGAAQRAPFDRRAAGYAAGPPQPTSAAVNRSTDDHDGVVVGWAEPPKAARRSPGLVAGRRPDATTGRRGRRRVEQAFGPVALRRHQPQPYTLPPVSAAARPR